ncbi:AraC family transcriptional regulator [Luteithermobacter gelatinilyticus]|uniref:AraC family transcriptional regulator n=1 Tax=Luteithermobacter gelatinilyticus TaxID=2582913 RepID=UPI00143DA0FD|nr:AraC family transcriptional regulator [Luteithermobacter gelatinilyticus]
MMGDFPYASKTASPLSGYPVLHTTDLEEAQTRVSEIFCAHRLAPLDPGGKVQTLMNHAPAGEVSLNYLHYGPAVEIDPGKLQNFYLVPVPLQGRIEMRAGRQTCLVEPQNALVISPDQHARMKWSENTRNLIVKIDREALERCLAHILGAHLPRPLVFEPLLDQRRMYQGRWLRSVMHLQAELEAGPDRKIPVPLLNQLAELCKLALIYTQPHNYSDCLETGLTRVAPRYVKRAEDYIVANLKNTITIEDLVQASGVSARSLFAGFREFRGTTPMKFVRDQRLQKVHEELHHNDSRHTVTQIALKWGFSQLGRFSVEYRKKFGESPSETLRKGG